MTAEPDIRNIIEEAVPSEAPASLEPPFVVKPRKAEQVFLDHFGLSQQPFGVTPDLRFLYLGAGHRKALEKLNCATELNRGFVTLLAKPGMGKTSLLLRYLEELRDKARTAYLFQTDCDTAGLMRSVLTEVGLDGTGMDLPEMRAVLNRVLLGEMEAGRQFVLVIDEAQNLDDSVLESIRLLSNLETPWMKLMHIVLAGQPQLGERLAKSTMEQLRQRVSLAIRIEPLAPGEVNSYIDHRLSVAGHKGAPLFSTGARVLIAERSAGIPRKINNLCFCAMSFACAMNQKAVDRQMMKDVLDDLDDQEPGPAIERKEQKAAMSSADSKPDELNPALTPTALPIGITMNPPRARSWLAALLIAAGLSAFILGWLGVQFRVGERIDKLLGSSPTASEGVAVPTSTAPAPVAGLDITTQGPKLESVASDENIGAGQDPAAPSPVTRGQ